MTAIQNIFCVAVYFHRTVQNLIWNIYPSAEIANQIWGRKLFPGVQSRKLSFAHDTFDISSVESQKGVIADQRCSIENQKGATATDFVQQ